MSKVLDFAFRYVVPVLCSGANIAAGVLNLRHNQIGPAIISFTFAGLIVGLNVSIGLARRKRDAAMRQMQHMMRRPECFLRAAHMTINPHAMQIAQQNLDLVAKAVGATKAGDCADGCCTKYEMRIGNHLYLVSYGQIEYRHGAYRSSTCMQDSLALPPPEHIASILLLLHNNPSLFTYWKDEPGHLYG